MEKRYQNIDFCLKIHILVMKIEKSSPKRDQPLLVLF